MKHRSRASRRSSGRRNWRLNAYCAITLFVAYENLDGAVSSFLRIGYVRADLAHLGYPGYFPNILGPGELCIAVALLRPALLGRQGVGVCRPRYDVAVLGVPMRRARADHGVPGPRALRRVAGAEPIRARRDGAGERGELVSGALLGSRRAPRCPRRDQLQRPGSAPQRRRRARLLRPHRHYLLNYHPTGAASRWNRSTPTSPWSRARGRVRTFRTGWPLPEQDRTP